MKRELKGDMAFDGSTIIELIYSTPFAKDAQEAIKTKVLKPFATEISIAEAKYILCRKLGGKEASSRLNDLLESNAFKVEEITREISDLAGGYKCERSISLADCFALALGKSKAIPVVFARMEKEIEKEMKSNPFDVNILFLEDSSHIH